MVRTGRLRTSDRRTRLLGRGGKTSVANSCPNRSQHSSQLVTVVYLWVQRPAVDRSRPVSGPMSGWGAGSGVGVGWRATNFAL